MKDEERLIKLKNIYEKYFEHLEEDLQIAISTQIDNFEKINSFYKLYEEQRTHLESEVIKLFTKAKKYFQHYFMALSMAIDREEIPENVAEYYRLSYPFEIPDTNDYEEFLLKAKNLFEDDHKRILNGGKHFTNPSIATVKVYVEKFEEKYLEFQSFIKAKIPKIENIEAMRHTTDKLIFEITGEKTNETNLVAKNEKSPTTSSNCQLSLDFDV